MLARRLLLAARGGGSFTPPPPPPSWPAWLTGAMNNGPATNTIYMFSSDDGLSWSVMNGGSPVCPADSGYRDPSILHIYGKWWMGVTSGGSYWTLLSSDDLLAWTVVTTLTAGDGTSVWAPQWMVDADGSPHVFLSANYSYYHQIFEMHPTDEAMTSWASPVLVGAPSGSGPNVIDPSVVLQGGTYHMAYADANGWGLALATASSLTGPYTTAWDSPYGGNLAGLEAPALLFLGDRWRLYGISPTFYDSNGWYYSETTTPLDYASWSAKSQLHTMDGYNHPVPVRTA